MLLSENDLFLSRDDAAQLFRFKIGVLAAFGLSFEAIHHALELFVGDPNNDLAKQRSESSIGIERESKIAGLLCQSLYSLFVQAEVQNCVHHAGH